MIEDVVAHCPSCGEAIDLAIDTTGGDRQSYVEDCAVCCRPMRVVVECRPGSVLSVRVSAD